VRQFDIITEADARVLPPGTRVALAPGGHITPLARDTLRERRITVVHEGRVAEDEAGLMPVADVRRVAVASDHTGVTLRRHLVSMLRGRGLAVLEHDGSWREPVDYPDVAVWVADAVATGEADTGIVIDGAGIGSAIAANKVSGIRAATAASETIARYAREHNGANVLTLGSTLIGAVEADRIVTVWLSARMREPRYVRRLGKIREIERRGGLGRRDQL
jgi:ribose 5-phosphate isomerase B